MTELHQAGVKVLLSFNVWDTLTRDQGGGSLRNGQALGRFASATGADGFLMDTYVGTTATLHSACPHSALESEGYTNSSSTSYQTMADAKWTGHEAVWADLDPPTAPAADIVKWSKDSRWMSMGEFRGSRNLTSVLHQMLFNGVGVNVWENLWGSFHETVPHDAELLRRVSAICRFWGKEGYLTSPGWQPFAEEISSDTAFGTKFPGTNGALFLLVNKVSRPASAVVKAAPGLTRAVDCYRGQPLPLGTSATDAVTVELEPLGIGCVFFASNTTVPGLSSFLVDMERLTEGRPLPSFSFEPRVEPHVMRLRQYNSSVPKLSTVALTTSRMVRFNTTEFRFRAAVASCSGSGALQFPWESKPQLEHDETIRLAAFAIERSP